MKPTNDVNRKALGGLLSLVVTLAALLFLPAWTLDYWQAWMFLLVFSVSVLLITVYLMSRDPGLLERRIQAGPGAEREALQKIIQFLASVVFVAMFVVSALDHRFRWSTVPVYVVMAGDSLVALGLLGVFFVFRENTFTSATIEVDTAQVVISTGPYAFVRHPMYIEALIMLAGVPLALGSWWGLLTLIPMTLVIVWRLLDEERFLAQNLSGYQEYTQRVRYRLLPFIW